MKLGQIIIGLFFMLSCLGLHKEAEAVRAPLRPLNREKFLKMIADADVIATGAVTLVTQSKTLEPPLENVIIHVILKPERILKGNMSIKTIVIEEFYQQFSSDDSKYTPDGRQAAEKNVTGRISGPAPPVGRYRDGDRILVFLKSLDGLNQYLPLGSGNHDAYLGVFQISSKGVKSDRYRLDEVMTGYAGSEACFLDFVILNRENRDADETKLEILLFISHFTIMRFSDRFRFGCRRVEPLWRSVRQSLCRPAVCSGWKIH